VGTGKEYRKEAQGLKGAALFYLSLKKGGSRKLAGAKTIIKATFKDLGVTTPDVEKYIARNRAALEDILEKRVQKKRDRTPT